MSKINVKVLFGDSVVGFTTVEHESQVPKHGVNFRVPKGMFTSGAPGNIGYPEHLEGRTFRPNCLPDKGKTRVIRLMRIIP